MIIRCPSCSTTYKIEGAVFDAPQPTFRCSRCKHVFAVQVRLQLRGEDAPAAGTTTPPTPEGPPSVDPGPDAEDGSDAQEPADPGGPTDTETSEPEPTPPETGMAARSAEPPEPEPPETGAAARSAEPPEPEPEPEPAPEPPAPSAPPIRTDGDPVRVIDLGDADFPHPDFDPPAARTGPPDAPRPDLPEPAPVIETIDLPRRSARAPDFRIDDDILIPRGKRGPPRPRPRTAVAPSFPS